MRAEDLAVSEIQYTRFDDRGWPIVVVRPPRQSLDGPGFSEHMKRLVAYFERGEDFAFAVDIRDAAPMPAAQRRTMADELDRCAQRYPSIRSYAAIIIASAVQRGIVKAITWLTRQPGPTQVFASLDEGIAWCNTMIARGKAERRRASH